MGLTLAQQSAVDFEGNSLLVSAAAGSGKTFVLSQRVIRKLTDVKNPVDADRLMILTFTEAAAGEMRDRIIKALREAQAKDPENALIRRQLVLISGARISTIHSACLSIIRENFQTLGIDPQTSVADEGRLALMKSDMLSDFIEELYTRAENDPDIKKLIAYFTAGGKDGELFEVIDKLSEFLEKQPYPELYAKKVLENDCQSVFSMFGGKIKSRLESELSQIIITYEKLIERASADQKLVDCYMSDRDSVALLYKALTNDGYDSAVKLAKEIKFNDHPKKTAKSIPAQPSLKRMRDLLKSDLQKLISNYLFNFEKTVLEDRREELKLLSTLVPVCLELNARLYEKRVKNRLMSYDDIEKYALKLVIKTTDGVNFEKTELAKELSRDIDEIIVDEYQDCNKSQDLIFFALSKDGKNIFTVGDVKQSIYRFRGARPELFIERQKNSVPVTKDDSARYPTRIDLNCNFRSTPQILDFVNGVFERIMTDSSGGIDYKDGHALATHESVIRDEHCKIGVDIVIPDVIRSFTVDVGRAYEAQYVAKRIKELVGRGAMITDTKTGKTRKIRYSDIAILLRAPKNDGVFFEKALSDLSIGCVNNNLAENFFESPHIMAVMAFLQTLDNPYNEIPLVTVMYSEFFSFSVNELGAIRTMGKHLTFFDAVKEYAKQDAKTKAFVDTVEYLRNIALTSDVYGIISAVYEKSGIFLKLSKKSDSAKIKANLMLLLDFAADFEASRYRGLFAFIDYVAKISARSDSASPARLKTDADCVTIMSVHKSKGLEYPVVFMSGCASLLGYDSNLPIRFDNDTGISLNVRDFEKHRNFKSLCRNIINANENENDLAEYLRLLYVALTRAKNRLYITACTDLKNLESTVTEADFSQGAPTKYDVTCRPSFLKWILFSMYNTKSYRDLCTFCGVETQGVGQDTVATVRFEITKDEPEESSALQKESDSEIIDKEKIKTLLSRNYAFEKSTEIPAKLSVSEIKRKSASKTTFYKPAFMSDSVSGKDVGTATHSFLQFCDFSAITDYASFEKERQRLIDFEFITERFANLTDGEGVTAFLTSPKMRELVKTGTCKKEQKFIFTLPAREVTDIDSDEPVVIQGIIDCWFVVDNKAVIVDYKTDYVKTEAELIDRYKTQLDMYERAIFENYGIETQDKYIYSFCLKKFIKL